jgi:hypothetical protein
MKNKVALALVAAMLIAVMPGCPGFQSALVGLWIFTIDGEDYAVELQASGQAQAFPIGGGGEVLGGTLTYGVVSNQFVLIQNFEENKWIYAAPVESETMLEGARVKYDGTDAGTGIPFTAEKQVEEEPEM